MEMFLLDGEESIHDAKKLFEEISYNDETITKTRHPKIMRLRGVPPSLDQIQEAMRDLADQLFDADASQLKQALRHIVPEYLPFMAHAPEERHVIQVAV